MNSFFTATGSSPPLECHDDTGGHDPHAEDREGISPLREELVEALAGLLAEALVKDIRQYPVLPGGSLATPPSGERPAHAS